MVTPKRYLATQGQAVWDAFADDLEASPALAELLQVLCEGVDERVGLRPIVLRDGEWRDRVALRSLDAQVIACLTAIHDRRADAHANVTSFDDMLAALVDPSQL